ncbi:MAG: hypothetical protein KGL35_21855 [Bradyrhizobium sp.]|uniref:hypothetical protein n=1 Tax=Bradyrhizobium sp. TaxID=376 RepID=UPI00239436DC|nr:hypothetical protein [Bradyrhizobium sp.]MDE2471301.1 hypothetical protein [Bradyrhizobium sp.]
MANAIHGFSKIKIKIKQGAAGITTAALSVGQRAPMSAYIRKNKFDSIAYVWYDFR